MQYGDLKLSKEHIVLYMGTNPANDNYTYIDENFLRPPAKAVNQRDADLLHFWDKVCAQPSLFQYQITAVLLLYFFVSKFLGKSEIDKSA